MIHTLHLLCILSLLSLHQLHLRSSGIGSRRLRTPLLEAVMECSGVLLPGTKGLFCHFVFMGFGGRCLRLTELALPFCETKLTGACYTGLLGESSEIMHECDRHIMCPMNVSESLCNYTG